MRRGSKARDAAIVKKTTNAKAVAPLAGRADAILPNWINGTKAAIVKTSTLDQRPSSSIQR
jgi:hypothetical protein